MDRSRGVAVKPTVVRRLTVTMANEETGTLQESTVERMDCDGSVANDENAPAAAGRRRSTFVLGKRPLVAPAEDHLMMKKSKMDAISEKPNLNQQMANKPSMLSRQQQLLMWRDKRQKLMTANKSSANLSQHQTLQRRQTLAVLRTVHPSNDAGPAAAAGLPSTTKPTAVIRPAVVPNTASSFRPPTNQKTNPAASDRRRSVAVPSQTRRILPQPPPQKTANPVRQTVRPLPRPSQSRPTFAGTRPTTCNSGTSIHPPPRQQNLKPQNKSMVEQNRRETMAARPKNIVTNRRQTIAPIGGHVAQSARIAGTRRSSFGIKQRVGGILRPISDKSAPTSAKKIVIAAKQPVSVQSENDILHSSVKIVEEDPAKGDIAVDCSLSMSSAADVGTKASPSVILEEKAKTTLVSIPAAHSNILANSTMNEDFKGKISSTPVAEKGPRVSTPFSTRRNGGRMEVVMGTVTPSLSAIPHHKTVSFLESSCQKNNTPRVTRTPALTKEMSMREKLTKWLASHGKTPSRYRHMMCFGCHAQPPAAAATSSGRKNKMSSSRASISHDLQRLNLSTRDEGEPEAVPVSAEEAELEGEDAGDIDKQLTALFKECMLLLRAGFPAAHLSTWLDDVAQLMPIARRMPGYHLCKARIAAKCSNDDYGVAISVLDEGIAQHAELGNDLAQVRCTFERALNESQNSQSLSHSALKRRQSTKVQPENVFESSAVKLCLRRKSTSTAATPQQMIAVPVRRSTRRSCAALPPALRDHDVIVESLDEIGPEACDKMLFQDNVALKLEWHFTEDAAETKDMDV